MNGGQRQRITARFARAWKRKIRADEGRHHRQINRKRRLDANKRIAVTLMTAAAVAALLAIWMMG
jgi:hypothetical protein